jgi:uncharacterized protein
MKQKTVSFAKLLKNQFSVVLLIVFCSIFNFSVFAEGINTRETMVVSINGNRLEVEIADTPVKRQVGLMYRESMPENSGMLFVFPTEDFKTFWMKNTYIPLSIAYFTTDKVLVTMYDMKPNQTSEVYPSTKKIIYALEVNQGWFEKRKIKKGDRLVLSKEISGI